MLPPYDKSPGILTKSLRGGMFFKKKQEEAMKKISLKIVLRLWLVCVVLSLIFATATSTPGEAATEKKLYMTTGLTIRKVVIIPASVDDVWKSWTTKEGVITFFAPKASVELAVGGDYEMYFDPKKPEG